MTPEQHEEALIHARQHGDPDALVPFAFRGHIPRKGLDAAGSLGHGALRARSCSAGEIAMLDPELQADYIAKARKSYAKAYPWKYLAKHAPTKDNSEGERFTRAECIKARAEYGEGVLVELDPVELAKSRGFTGRGESKALEFLRGLSDYELNNEPEVKPVSKPGRKSKSKAKASKPAPETAAPEQAEA